MVTKVNSICPSCGEDREQLKAWILERDILTPILNRKWGYQFIYQRSDNHQKALELIAKCSCCQSYFKEG